MSPVLSGPDGREHFFLDTLTVGTDPKRCGFVLGDPNVSGMHATFEWLSHGWTLRDHGSTNGTSVNHRALGRLPQPLKEGDLVRFARGRPWTVTSLEPLPMALPREKTGRSEVLPDLPVHLYLSTEDFDTGEIRVETGDQVHTVREGNIFLLFWLLAEDPAEKKLTREVENRIWRSVDGRPPPSANLDNLVYRARQLLKSWNLTERILARQDGYLWLNLPAACIHRSLSGSGPGAPPPGGGTD